MVELKILKLFRFCQASWMNVVAAVQALDEELLLSRVVTDEAIVHEFVLILAQSVLVCEKKTFLRLDPDLFVPPGTGKVAPGPIIIVQDALCELGEGA